MFIAGLHIHLQVHHRFMVLEIVEKFLGSGHVGAVVAERRHGGLDHTPRFIQTAFGIEQDRIQAVSDMSTSSFVAAQSPSLYVTLPALS